MVESNKIALKYAYIFLKENFALTIATVAIFVLLGILSFIPFLGIIFIFAYSLLSLSLQIYFGKNILNIKEEEKIKELASNTKIGDFLTKYLSEATGAFLAFFTISFILFMLFILILMIFGVDIDMEHMQRMNEEEFMFYMMMNFSIPGTFFMFLIGFLLYIFPGVMGEIIKSDGFNESFKKAFLIINPSFWKRCFNKDYFILILVWSLILFVFFTFSSLLSATIILLPIALILGYYISLYNAAIYTFASNIVNKEIE